MNMADKLTTIAENQQKIYDAGYAAGASENGDYDAAYAAGKQAEYDTFWDEYQSNGSRTDYSNAFAGAGWTTNTFNPKYDIAPVNGYMMFRYSTIAGDLVEILDSLGVSLDTSNITNPQYMFCGTQFTRIGELDFSNVTTNPYYWFQTNSSLVTIDKLICNPNMTKNYTNCFSGCTALENITIEPNTIGNNGLNFNPCTKLTVDSLVSILNGLVDKSSDTSGTSWVLTLGATNLAKLTNEEKAIATEKGWTLA